MSAEENLGSGDPTRSHSLDRIKWIARLAAAKLKEGPVPFLRAARRGAFDALPASWRASLARRRFRLPKSVPNELVLSGSVIERSGLVSVILPVFNQCELLAESIESVLAQTYDRLELIVIDDGSSDDVDSVLSRITDRRVRILRQVNQRLPRALSNAFRFARGEFRTWTSADNIMEPLQLERLVAFLETNPTTAMVYADYMVIGPDGAPLKGSDFRPHNRSSPESSEIRLPRSTEMLNLKQDNFIGACFLYRGWVGRCLGAYSSELGIEDYDYWMRIHSAFTIQHLGTDELLYRYRWHDNSLSAQTRELQLVEAGQQLMRHERERAVWRAEPWEVIADEDDLSSVTAPIEECSGKRIAFLSPSDMQPEGLAELPADLVVALQWEGDPASVYRWSDRLRDPRLVHFATDPVMIRTLGLFTERVFEIGPGPERFALACAAGNEFICSQRGGRETRHPLPRVWTPPDHRRRVLFQAEGFAEGGLERTIVDLAASLDRRGFVTAVLAMGELGAMAEVARNQGTELFTLDERTPDAYGALLEAWGPDVVLASHSLFGTDIARDRGIPFVQTVHNTVHWFYPDEIESWRRADAATTAYIHVSANVALFAHEKLGLDRDKSLVLRNGVRLPAVDGTVDSPVDRESLGLRADDYVFLNVASIYPPKNQVALARALATARRSDPRIKVVVLGRSMNDGYAGQLAGEIAALGLEGSFVLAGYHDEAEPFYRLANAFVLPSYWEGCSLSVAEALVRDLPCVLSDVGAARDQLGPGEGVVIPGPFPTIEGLDFGNLKSTLAKPREGFVEDLAEAMVSVAANSGRLTPDPRRRERFDVEGVADRFAATLDWIATGGQPSQARPFSWADFRDGALLA